MTLLEKRAGRLRNQNAWITGGKRVGRSVARMLAEQGVNLVVGYRFSEAEALATVAEAQALGVRAIAVQADVSLVGSLQAAIDRVRQEFSEIHILINMASIYRPAPVENVTQADWEENFAAHVLGTFFPSQLIVPFMPPGSHIVNVADITSISRAQKNNLPYVVTKAAVAAMTKTLALEYGKKGIFVNALAPGPILPPDDFPKEKWQRIRDRSPVKFPMTDEEAVEQFALLTLYLCLNTMASGQVYPLDQGQSL